MKSKTYWRNRALASENRSYLRGIDLLERLFAEYGRASSAIERETRSFYDKYAKKHGLTYDQATKTLTQKEYQEFKQSLDYYVHQINSEEDPDIKKRLIMELDARSYNAQMTRLDALNGQITMKVNSLFAEGVKASKEAFGELFKEAYYYKSYLIQSRAGVLHQMARINENLVERVLNYPWSGHHFSDRLWHHKDQLLFETRQILTQGIIQGRGSSVMAKALSDRMGVGYKQADRLIKTEVSHFHSAADKEAYKNLDIEKYEFLATLDSDTCNDCSPLHGKIFLLENAVESDNYPVMHPNCRCTTVEADDVEELSWIKDGTPMKNMSYDEWKNTNLN